MSGLVLVCLFASVQLVLSQDCTPSATGYVCMKRGTLQVDYKESGQNVDFIIKSTGVPSNGYVAVGFNTAAQMSGASIVECIVYSGGSTKLSLSKAPAQTRPTTYQYPQGITSSSVSYTGGTLECRFSRPKVAPNGAASEFVSLTDNNCIIMAMGAADSSGSAIQYHNTDRHTFGCGIDFAAAAPTTAPPPTGCLLSNFGCLRQNGLEVNFREVGDNVEFYVRGNPPNTNGYVALGFNTELDMSGSSIIECIAFNGNINIRTTYADAEAMPPVIEATSHVSQPAGNQSDGQLLCHFVRPKALPSGAPDKFRDISGACLLMSAGSATTASQIARHTVTAKLKCGVDYTQVGLTEVHEKLEPLVAGHGILMILAWMGLLSKGMIYARFYKKATTKQCLGKDAWFRTHQVYQTLGLLCVIVAFILIFVEEGEFVHDKIPLIHAICGIIATAFCLAQPIMAAFRCHPGTENRPIFNWAHFLVGNSAHILAVVCIFLAGTFDDIPGAMRSPGIYFGLAIAYVGTWLLVTIILEIIKRMEDSDNQVQSNGTSNQMQISEGGNEQKTSDEKRQFKKRVIYTIYDIVNITICVVLIVHLW